MKVRCALVVQSFAVSWALNIFKPSQSSRTWQPDSPHFCPRNLSAFLAWWSCTFFGGLCPNGARPVLLLSEASSIGRLARTLFGEQINHTDAAFFSRRLQLRAHGPTGICMPPLVNFRQFENLQLCKLSTAQKFTRSSPDIDPRAFH